MLDSIANILGSLGIVAFISYMFKMIFNYKDMPFIAKIFMWCVVVSLCVTICTGAIYWSAKYLFDLYELF